MNAKPWKRILRSAPLCALMLLTLAISAPAETSGETSQTTGLPTDKPYRPILVVVSNSEAARPPWGLSEADVVYEEIIWGPYHTRYLGLFNDCYPEKAGSMRGARVFDVEMRQAWDCPIAHAGGQQRAGTDIYMFFKALDVPGSMRIDPVRTSTANDYVQREASRPIPHNMTLDIKRWAEDRWPADNNGKPYAPRDNGLRFDDSPTRGRTHEDTILLAYGEEYQASYAYDAEESVYIRRYNGEMMVDAYTQAPYTYSNVIVQVCQLWYYDDSPACPVIMTTGGGLITAYIAGQRIEGTWLREKITDAITYCDGDGNPLLLARGKTFVQVVPPGMYASHEGDDVYTDKTMYVPAQ